MGLALAYHADGALAQVIHGESTDDQVAVAWEYDLEIATGEVLIRNINFQLQRGERLHLPDLVPAGATDIQFDPQTVILNRCTASASVPLHALAALPPGQETVISFRLPPADWSKALAPAELDYGTGFLLSGAVCITVPVSFVPEFVTVRPLPGACAEGDFDGDRDVDLRDYAEFQRRYTGPRE